VTVFCVGILIATYVGCPTLFVLVVLIKIFVFAPVLFSIANCWLNDEVVELLGDFEREVLATAAGDNRPAASEGREAIFCIETDEGSVILDVGLILLWSPISRFGQLMNLMEIKQQALLIYNSNTSHACSITQDLVHAKNFVMEVAPIEKIMQK